MRRISALWGALLVLTVAVIAVVPRASQAAGDPVPGSTEPPSGAGHLSHLIIVMGQGSIEATPDRATVTLGIEVIRPTAQEAQERSSTVMEQIVSQVGQLGIPRERFQTVTVGLSPQRKEGDSQITGYEASNRITVTIDDLHLTGRVIDAGVAAGATSIDSLSFGLRDDSTYKSRALRIAVQSAQAAATVIAGQAGLGPLHLVRIEEVGTTVMPRMGVAAPMLAATPVSPGLLPVTAQVRAFYTF